MIELSAITAVKATEACRRPAVVNQRSGGPQVRHAVDPRRHPTPATCP
jgi:hypothetical protein